MKSVTKIVWIGMLLCLGIYLGLAAKSAYSQGFTSCPVNGGGGTTNPSDNRVCYDFYLSWQCNYCNEEPVGDQVSITGPYPLHGANDDGQVLTSIDPPMTICIITYNDGTKALCSPVRASDFAQGVTRLSFQIPDPTGGFFIYTMPPGGTWPPDDVSAVCFNLTHS